MFRHHHRHIAFATAMALALYLCVASVASADPQPLAKAEAAIASNQSPGSPMVQPNPDEQVAWPRTQSPVVRVVTPDGGFDWADAAIGGCAALVLVGLGLAATRAATSGRRRYAREQRAIVTN